MQRLLLVLLCAGCGILKLVPSNGSGGAGDGPEGHHVQIEGRTYRVGPYWGPECVRIGANGEPAAAMADCSGTISTTTCVEHGVPAGTWTYVDTPAQVNWTGAPSPASFPVVVG